MGRLSSFPCGCVVVILCLLLLLGCAGLHFTFSHWPCRHIRPEQPLQAAQQYDQVIAAIQQYHADHGQYPLTLATLVPDYLPSVPSIYIPGGDLLDYLALPSYGVPFTFYVYGYCVARIPYLHDWEEWELRYCPSDLCTYQNIGPYERIQRIDENWLWIHRDL